MDKWNKSLTDDVSADFEKKVLSSVRPLLKENAELFASRKKTTGFRWQLFALPGLAAALLITFTVIRLSSTSDSVPVAQTAPLSPELEIAMDFAMFKDLQEIESLELLQKLGDPSKWPKRSRKAPKS